jgi:CheY-like chemotaxis protein
MAQELVIEDDETTRQGVRDWLDWEEHAVVTVSGGVDGLRMLRNTTQRLVVVLDDLMPDLRGMDLLRTRVREEPSATTRHRFILVTASSLRLARNPYATKFLQSHHIPVLEKPFSLDMLYDLVQQAVADLERGTAATLPEVGQGWPQGDA